jgi:ribosomal protein L29
MTTKRTRSRRKQSSLRFDMAVMGIRQTNLAIMTRDALMRMQMKIEELEEEINKLKER